MSQRKTWFSYVAFFGGTAFLSVYLYTLFVSFIGKMEEMMGKKIYIFGISLSRIAAAVIVVLLVGLFFLLSYFKGLIKKEKLPFLTLFNKFIYVVSVSLFFVYGLIRRILVIKEFNGDIAYYRTSIFKRLISLLDGETVTFDSFVNKVYSNFLTFLFKVFGINNNIPAIANCFLFLASAILLFFSVKFIFGNVPALMGFVFYVTVPTSMDFIFDLSGINLYLFVFSFLIFTVSYFLCGKERKPLILYGTVLLSLLVCGLVDHFFFRPIVPGISADYFYSVFSSFDYFWGAIVIVVFSLYSCLSFINSDDDSFSLAIVINLLLFLLSAVNVTNTDTVFIFRFSLCICGGIGIKWFLFDNYKNDSKEELTKRELPKEKLPKEELPKEELPKEDIKKDVKTPVIEEIPDDKEQDKVMDTLVKPKFIENPLPVPKKHVKKIIGYAFEPSKEEMKYDIEVSSDDDFDIK